MKADPQCRKGPTSTSDAARALLDTVLARPALKKFIEKATELATTLPTVEQDANLTRRSARLRARPESPDTADATLYHATSPTDGSIACPSEAIVVDTDDEDQSGCTSPVKPTEDATRDSDCSSFSICDMAGDEDRSSSAPPAEPSEATSRPSTCGAGPDRTSTGVTAPGNQADNAAAPAQALAAEHEVVPEAVLIDHDGDGADDEEMHDAVPGTDGNATDVAAPADGNGAEVAAPADGTDTDVGAPSDDSDADDDEVVMGGHGAATASRQDAIAIATPDVLYPGAVVAMWNITGDHGTTCPSRNIITRTMSLIHGTYAGERTRRAFLMSDLATLVLVGPDDPIVLVQKLDIFLMAWLPPVRLRDAKWIEESPCPRQNTGLSRFIEMMHAQSLIRNRLGLGLPYNPSHGTKVWALRDGAVLHATVTECLGTRVLPDIIDVICNWLNPAWEKVKWARDGGAPDCSLMNTNATHATSVVFENIADDVYVRTAFPHGFRVPRCPLFPGALGFHPGAIASRGTPASPGSPVSSGATISSSAPCGPGPPRNRAGPCDYGDQSSRAAPGIPDSSGKLNATGSSYCAFILPDHVRGNRRAPGRHYNKGAGRCGGTHAGLEQHNPSMPSKPPGPNTHTQGTRVQPQRNKTMRTSFPRKAARHTRHQKLFRDLFRRRVRRLHAYTPGPHRCSPCTPNARHLRATRRDGRCDRPAMRRRSRHTVPKPQTPIPPKATNPSTRHRVCVGTTNRSL